MKGRVGSRKIESTLLVGMLAAAGFLAACEPSATSEVAQVDSGETQATTSTAAAEKPESKPTAPAEASGMRVYIDPQTGEFVEPPAGAPPVEASPEVEGALSTSSEGLVETPSPTPGGGVMVDLKGRFQSEVTVTRDADGKTTVQCLPDVPGSDKKE